MLSKLVERMFADYLPKILFISIFIPILGFIIKYRYLITRIIRRNIYIKLLLIFTALFIVGTFGTYLFEKEVNENFMNFYQGLWSSIVYLSGFEDMGPVTLGGRTASLLIFVASICILGSIAGSFASIFMKRSEVKMPKDIKKHIVICNWSEKGERIIRELHSSVAVPDVGIVVISKKRPFNEQDLRRNYPNEYSNVEFRESDPTLHSSLKGVNAHLARSVIILADDNDPDPDANSALIALAVNALWRQRVGEEVSKRVETNAEDEEKGEPEARIRRRGKFKKPYIVAEAINHRKMEHLKNAGVDEMICATDYGIGILAQCALQEKLSDAYQQLLTYTGETNELYLVEYGEVPKKLWEKLKGKSFGEAADLFNKNRDSDNPVVLVGVKRNDKVILNPKKSWRPKRGEEKKKFEEFEKGDSLIVMAFEYPNLSKLTASIC